MEFLRKQLDLYLYDLLFKVEILEVLGDKSNNRVLQYFTHKWLCNVFYASGSVSQDEW